jgi:hypothetical protein
VYGGQGYRPGGGGGGLGIGPPFTPPIVKQLLISLGVISTRWMFPPREFAASATRVCSGLSSVMW